ncbi:SRPBCC family protein [Jatrophihabitans endophyticus]|uniref:SRPBCC family protein n=1 Tax=Jatrophihabitans endophyticus TaxID=1206085 RepID=UPI001A0C7F9C|nr:SRPBCC family protein [Jatrophihabitans endophyticus]MBE7190230.1 SRPBCC family protein [Jatrophihabitans endophyticus]
MTVSDSVVVAVAPEAVYEAVADPTRTGEWSPENLGARVEGDARPGPLPVGTTFVGRNRRRGMRWSTRCRVIDAVPGRSFAFRVEAIGLRTPRLSVPIATWYYDLEPADGGTKVTETWEDNRKSWSDARAARFDRIATGSTFAEFQTRNIATTLARLKAALER